MNIVEIFDFTAYIKTELKSTLSQESETFDDCVKAEIKKNFDKEEIKCFFTRNFGNNCQTIVNKGLLNSMKTIFHETKCKKHKTVLNTYAEFSNGFSRQYIKKDPYGKDVDIFIEIF